MVDDSVDRVVREVNRIDAYTDEDLISDFSDLVDYSIDRVVRGVNRKYDMNLPKPRPRPPPKRPPQG